MSHLLYINVLLFPKEQDREHGKLGLHNQRCSDHQHRADASPCFCGCRESPVHFLTLVMLWLPLLTRHPARARPPLMQSGMYGGDLEGGRDKDRNANIARLKSLFYKEDATDFDDAGAAGSAELLGLLRDIPVARFRMCILPHQQTAFNIFQPQLVHFFETLMGTEKPWVFMNAPCPVGSVEAFGNPLYELPGLGDDPNGAPGPEATLQGTLMEIVAAERQADARILLVAHGLGRAIVTRGTQSLPFSRGDVQMLHDTEALAAARQLSRSLLAERTPTATTPGSPAALTAVLTVAAAEERSWRAYEFAPVDFNRAAFDAASARFEPSALRACVEKASAAAAEAVAAAESAASDEEVVVARLDSCTPLRSALDDVVEAAEDAAEVDVRLGGLETQLWLELDAFFVAYTAERARLSGGGGGDRGDGRGGGVRAPPHILSLLPPPPSSGWPEGFALDVAAEEQRQRAADLEAVSLFNPGVAREAREPLYPPCDGPDEGYPLRRRAQRLSYAIWTLLSRDTDELQRALEAPSTSDRLRMALLRLRALRKEVEGDD